MIKPASLRTNDVSSTDFDDRLQQLIRDLKTSDRSEASAQDLITRFVTASPAETLEVLNKKLRVTVHPDRHSEDKLFFDMVARLAAKALDAVVGARPTTRGEFDNEISRMAQARMHASNLEQNLISLLNSNPDDTSLVMKSVTECLRIREGKLSDAVISASIRFLTSKIATRQDEQEINQWLLIFPIAKNPGLAIGLLPALKAKPAYKSIGELALKLFPTPEMAAAKSLYQETLADVIKDILKGQLTINEHYIGNYIQALPIPKQNQIIEDCHEFWDAPSAKIRSLIDSDTPQTTIIPAMEALIPTFTKDDEVERSDMSNSYSQFKKHSLGLRVGLINYAIKKEKYLPLLTYCSDHNAKLEWTGEKLRLNSSHAQDRQFHVLNKEKLLEDIYAAIKEATKRVKDNTVEIDKIKVLNTTHLNFLKKCGLIPMSDYSKIQKQLLECYRQVCSRAIALARSGDEKSANHVYNIVFYKDGGIFPKSMKLKLDALYFKTLLRHGCFKAALSFSSYAEKGSYCENHPDTLISTADQLDTTQRDRLRGEITARKEAVLTLASGKQSPWVGFWQGLADSIKV